VTSVAGPATAPSTRPAALPAGRAGSRVIDLDEEARLGALHDLAVLDTAPEERFDRVTRLAQRLFGVEIALVTLIDRDRQWFKSRAGTDLEEVPRDLSFCSVAIRSGDTTVVRDLLADERFASNPLLDTEQPFRFYASQPLEAPGGHRVGTLCLLDPSPKELSEPEQETLRDLAEYVQQELVLDEEFDRAAQVQRSLLPRHVPELPGHELAGACLPARAVGGDFFDWYAMDGGAVFTVADVMGKGVGAAIVTATVRAVLRAVATTGDQGGTLEEAAETLEPDLDQTGTFVTLFQAYLDPARGVVSFADAGHNLALVLRSDGSWERPTSGGLPLGALPGGEWDTGELTLAPGDMLLVFSDGLLDLFGGSVRDLDHVVSCVAGAGSAQAAVDRTMAVARRSRLTDDVTVVALRRSTDKA
jgi:hypothetical protein